MMTREEGRKRLREHYREEGRAARSAGVPVADCPYTPAAPPDSKWGIQAGVEWLKGWHGTN
jgi:hypothetical protein